MSYELSVESVDYKFDENGRKIKVTVGYTSSGTKVIIEEPEHSEEEMMKIFENMMLNGDLRFSDTIRNPLNHMLLHNRDYSSPLRVIAPHLFRH